MQFYGKLSIVGGGTRWGEGGSDVSSYKYGAVGKIDGVVLKK